MRTKTRRLNNVPPCFFVTLQNLLCKSKHRRHSQPVFRLELVPGLVERRKHRGRDELHFGRGVLWQLYVRVSFGWPCALRLPLGARSPYLVGVRLGDSLHVMDLDAVRHDKLVHAHLFPPAALPENLIQAAQQGSQVVSLAVAP